MQTVTGSFQDGVAKPDEPVHGHEGQPVLITFLSDDDVADRDVADRDTAGVDDFPTLEEVVERIRALGPSTEGYIPPKKRLSEVLSTVSDEPPIDPEEWDRQWAEIEAEMKQRDLDDDRAEGRV